MFSEKQSAVLAKHRPHDLRIELKDGTTAPYQLLYNLSAAELQLLRAYLNEYLKRGWI